MAAFGPALRPRQQRDLRPRRRIVRPGPVVSAADILRDVRRLRCHVRIRAD